MARADVGKHLPPYATLTIWLDWARRFSSSSRGQRTFGSQQSPPYGWWSWHRGM